MAYVALENGEASELTRDDFTVVSDDETGVVTLVIPRIAISVSSERWADWLVKDLIGSIDFYERAHE
jgi:hypothetical protein